MNRLGVAFEHAAAGPFAEGELISLRRNAKLRVTYNWLYSALNCDPNDASPFPWILTKVDAGHIALSPKNGYGGRTLYASVRPDWNWAVQVQAPHSADWIVAIGADEIVGMSSPGLQILRLQGLNGQFIAVVEHLSTHQGHGGYLVHSGGSAYADAYSWFLAASAMLQPGLTLPAAHELSHADIRNALASAGLDSNDAAVAHLQALLS